MTSDNAPPPLPVGSGMEVVQRHITYAPFDWATHPIDTVQQSQGWGPMAFPYTPINFESAKDSQTGGSGLDITWFKGDNTTDRAPTYAVLTLMNDKSLSLVNNQGFFTGLIGAGGASNTTSTIGQADDVQTSGVANTPKGAAGFWSSLKLLLAGA